MKRNPLGTLLRIIGIVALPVMAFVLTVGIVMMIQNGSVPKDLPAAAASYREDPPRKNASAGALIIKSLSSCIRPGQEDIPESDPHDTDPSAQSEGQDENMPEVIATYQVRINLSTNVITVFIRDEAGEFTIPVRAMLCSPCLDLPEGTFTMREQTRWTPLLSGLYGHFASRITDHVFLHAAPSTEQSEATVLVSQYNLLGTSYSHENVYVNASDAYWLYVNCTAYETEVLIGRFDSDPLGKPALIQLPSDPEINWDPTTPSDDNPWNLSIPYFTDIPKPFTIVAGSELPNLYSGVSGVDTCGNIVRYFVVLHEIDVNTPGTYTVTYAFTDILGREALAYTEVTVVPASEDVSDPENPSDIPAENPDPSDDPSIEESDPPASVEPEDNTENSAPRTLHAT